MNTNHTAQVTEELDGFSPASLSTTVNGLELILQALRLIEPEASEAGLRTALIQALEQAMPMCPKHQPLSAKTEAEIFDFNTEVFRRPAENWGSCVKRIHDLRDSAIKADLASGMSGQDVARKYGLTVSRVSQIRNT